MKLLVVEDDPAIAARICTGLREEGHSVTHVDNGADAIVQVADGPFDTVVLDRMLPDVGGEDVLRIMRFRSPSTPVIFLSAMSSVNDRIDGLRAGADDYLTKPFAIEELSARVEALARRTTRGDDSAALSVGRLMLDPAGHRAHFDGRAIELNRKQFSLLAHLIGHVDQLVTRRMLLEHVWGYAFEPATNIVESNMSRLRSRLQALGCDAIETRRGEGYVLVSHACA